MNTAQAQTPPLKFGDHVYYNLRNVQRVGRVTHLFKNFKNENTYHVRDDDGYYWHRTASELALYDGPTPLVPPQAPAKTLDIGGGLVAVPV